MSYEYFVLSLWYHSLTDRQADRTNDHFDILKVAHIFIVRMYEWMTPAASCCWDDMSYILILLNASHSPFSFIQVVHCSFLTFSPFCIKWRILYSVKISIDCDLFVCLSVRLTDWLGFLYLNLTKSDFYL